MGRVGCYDVGYDECSCTTEFATAPGSLDIARVSDAMVPPADNQHIVYASFSPSGNIIIEACRHGEH